jgi:hypothetical protein
MLNGAITARPAPRQSPGPVELHER